MTVVLSTKTLVLPMQKRYQTQDIIVKLVLKRAANCRFGGLPEKRPMCRLGDFESNPLMYNIVHLSKSKNFQPTPVQTIV